MARYPDDIRQEAEEKHAAFVKAEKALIAYHDAHPQLQALQDIFDEAERTRVAFLFQNKLPFFMRVGETDMEIVRCASTGKPIFADEDTREDEMGNLHLAVEVEKARKPETVAA